MSSARLERWREAGLTYRHEGRRIFVRRAGSGPVLVLIHGFPTASWDWHAIWDGLCARFDVIAPDMLGFGFSDKPRPHDYRLIDQAGLVESLLHDWRIDSVHLLAHDYGDSVAQELLARFASRLSSGAAGLEIRSVCLLNGGIIPGEHRPLPIQKLVGGPLGGVLVRLLGKGALRRSFRRIFGPRTQPGNTEIAEFWELITYNAGRRVLHGLLHYMTERKTHRERWVGILRTTPVPLRLIIGMHDPIAGAHVLAAYRALVADADAIALEQIGHYPQIEAPQQVLAAHSAFVDRIEGGAGRSAPPAGAAPGGEA